MPSICRRCEKVFHTFAKKIRMVCFLNYIIFFTTKLPAKNGLYVQVPIIVILLKNSYMRIELISDLYFSVAPT